MNIIPTSTHTRMFYNVLYLVVPPDGLLGQYLQLTQILTRHLVDPNTSLSNTYQILIHFDYGYQGMHKQEVQEAAAFRLDTLGIQIATCYCEPIFALVQKETKCWLGFLCIDLIHLKTDGIALFNGDRLFTLQLQNLEYVT